MNTHGITMWEYDWWEQRQLLQRPHAGSRTVIINIVYIFSSLIIHCVLLFIVKVNSYNLFIYDMAQYLGAVNTLPSLHFRQKIRSCTGRSSSREQWGGIMKLSNLQPFVTVNATAAGGHKSCVVVHCNQISQIRRGRPVQFLIFWRNDRSHSKTFIFYYFNEQCLRQSHYFHCVTDRWGFGESVPQKNDIDAVTMNSSVNCAEKWRRENYVAKRHGTFKKQRATKWSSLIRKIKLISRGAMTCKIVTFDYNTKVHLYNGIHKTNIHICHTTNQREFKVHHYIY